MKYRLTYKDGKKKVTLTLTEKDFKEWIEAWPDYAGPVWFEVLRIND